MEAGNAPRVAVLFALIAAALCPGLPSGASLSAQSPSYIPKTVRLEILKKWEKTGGAELDVLKERGVKAVFFIIGNYFLNAEGRPMPRAKELHDRVVNEGHVIGSHSYRHRRLDQGEYRDDREAIRRELDLNEAAIDKVLGYHYPIVYFRPPNGAHSTPRYELDRALRSPPWPERATSGAASSSRRSTS
jgi:hypothetical protein